MMDIRFDGKRALVTGAGKGIGRVAATMLAQCGAKVIALSRTQADLDSLKQEVPDVDTICVDIGDWDATKAALENVGPVHLLVNNAGVSKRQTFFEITKEVFDETIGINVRAVIQISQIIAKGMVERGGGVIVNVSSRASKVAVNQQMVYCASKGALDSLTQGMALELGPKGIRVNVVNPTITMTPMGVKCWSDPKLSDPIKQRIPLRRFAGIGRVTATKLAECGARVIALSRTQADLDSLKQEVPDVETICVDIGDWDATKAALENVGPVHLLVNNAGIAKLQSFFEITKDVFEETININLRGVLQISQIIAKGMVERGEGVIVNVSSVSSKVAVNQQMVYCASKSALDSLTQGMANELGPKGIRVNAVNPTITMTPLGVKLWNDPKVSDPVKQMIPLRRFAETEEVVHAILYLLSDKSSFINGVTLPVDGGFLATGKC
ncbi:L-xylulose reductase-like [Amphiura filiformis]|uniref:L-xylulose reductase-like n=1 Tax=Amphiura filiformis TaxID=82378 RepID=UPI003B21E1AC